MPEEEQVILRADMHCNACQQKIKKVLDNFPGVDKFDIDILERKVVVKGKVDAKSVFEAVKKRCGKRTLLLYPELPKEDDTRKDEGSDKPKDDPLPDVIVELKVKMHCGACAKDIMKILRKLDGVVDVDENIAAEKVIVKGKGLNAEVLCEKVKKAGKHCQIIQPSPVPAHNKEKIEEGPKETAEKKHQEKEEKREEIDIRETTLEIKNFVYPYSQIVHHYVYPPQLFSDENPNSCQIM